MSEQWLESKKLCSKPVWGFGYPTIFPHLNLKWKPDFLSVCIMAAEYQKTCNFHSQIQHETLIMNFSEICRRSSLMQDSSHVCLCFFFSTWKEKNKSFVIQSLKSWNNILVKNCISNNCILYYKNMC